ncbi:MAG: hypothetical protein QOJ53_2262 [Sphingomonadales bacterium]|jgi:hypothetical protein|nr:hypothetical protein [Sphingomonadales bacterium]MEA3047930.1 hypothetical protein [Sphingomonadales bacterium]
MMRVILLAVPLAFLAACGGKATTNAANAAAVNAAAPAAGAAAPANALGDARRADEIRECSDDVRTELPEGTDLNAFCGCAVDRMQTGLPERRAMEQCAAEMHIQPRGH